MIVSHIIGGIGNQMFQYAAGKALSLRLCTPLVLDLADFSDYRLHQGFELSDVFGCEFQIVTKDQIRDVLGWRSSKAMRTLLLKPQLTWLRGKCFFEEPYFHYWQGFHDISNGCYLFGYWQSEKYFESVSEVIRGDFVFRHALEGKNLTLAQQMKGCNAVSLHVRRGDYVSDDKTNSTHGVCSLDYYRDAVKHMMEHVSLPHFFIFSDDIAWCREHLGLKDHCSYIDHNTGNDSYRDMQMMSLCHHHIIANSSFSWWGAWLNPRGDKIVIAPKQWFVSGFNSSDLIPSAWLRL